MGKIVKFCGLCDEGFAEKFGFCPNCGQTLEAFEMNPLAAAAAAPEVLAAPVVAEFEMVERIIEPAEAVQESAPTIEESFVAADVAEPEIIDEPEIETQIIEAPAPKAAAANAFAYSTPIDVDRIPVSLEAEHSAYARSGGFYVTVIEDKNVGRRNALLLGTLAFVFVSLMTGMVYNLFSKDLMVGSINDDIFNAVIVDNVPTVVEDEPVQKDKKDAGGGGGGGREEKEETTQGDLADQTPDPIRPPDAKVPRLDNPSLVLPRPSTEGNKDFEQKFDRWGDPNGRFASFSNGTGSGGGQGSGTGTGQGSGTGTGAGSGTGSGSGGGLGSGNGSGTGVGDEGDGSPPPPRKAGITQGLAIVSKPRAGYTDPARKENVQGTVILRVTFLASGQIGPIATVKGLPNGLTEQAIAAARRISFKPKTVDGVAQSVTRQIEYSFSIY